MVNTVDAHSQLCHVKTGLLQRHSHRPAKLRPEPSAVCHQHCRTPDSWRVAPRPHHSAPCRPPLAVDASAHPVQAVHTGLPVRSEVHTVTELLAKLHLPGRECGITASPALCVIGRSHRAGDVTFNNGRLRLRHHRTERLEQSARYDPSQLITGHLQTLSEISLLYPVFLLTFFLLLLAFNALTLLVGHQEQHLACKKIQWWGVGVIIYLE